MLLVLLLALESQGALLLMSSYPLLVLQQEAAQAQPLAVLQGAPQALPPEQSLPQQVWVLLLLVVLLCVVAGAAVPQQQALQESPRLLCPLDSRAAQPPMHCQPQPHLLTLPIHCQQQIQLPRPLHHRHHRQQQQQQR